MPIWKISTARSRIVAIMALYIIAAPLWAQTPAMLPVTAPDSSQIMSMMANSMRLVRDRHAVGALLTPAQIAQLPMMEASDMMNGMKEP